MNDLSSSLIQWIKADIIFSPLCRWNNWGLEHQICDWTRSRSAWFYSLSGCMSPTIFMLRSKDGPMSLTVPPVPQSCHFPRRSNAVALWFLHLGFSGYFGHPVTQPQEALPFISCSSQNYRNRFYIQLFNPTVYALCYALWRHFDIFLFHNVNEADLSRILHSKIML